MNKKMLFFNFDTPRSLELVKGQSTQSISIFGVLNGQLTVDTCLILPYYRILIIQRDNTTN